MREDRDSLVERLHRQTAEYSAFKLENERLKVCAGSRARPVGRRGSPRGVLRGWGGSGLVRGLALELERPGFKS